MMKIVDINSFLTILYLFLHLFLFALTSSYLLFAPRFELCFTWAFAQPGHLAKIGLGDAARNDINQHQKRRLNKIQTKSD